MESSYKWYLLACKNHRKWAKRRFPWSHAEMSFRICRKGSPHRRTPGNGSPRGTLVAVILSEVSPLTALIRITPFIVAEVIRVLSLMCVFPEETDSRQVKHTWRFWPGHCNWPDKKVSLRFYSSVVVTLEVPDSVFLRQHCFPNSPAPSGGGRWKPASRDFEASLEVIREWFCVLKFPFLSLRKSFHSHVYLF